jgi:phosphate transport system substrate-binding protein
MTGAFVFTACNGEETPGTDGDGTTEANGDTTQAPPPPPVNDNFDFAKEILAITRDSASGTRSAFAELVGLKDGSDDIIDSGIRVVGSTGDVVTAVEAEEYAIGYVAFGSVSPRVRALAIDGVAATNENVLNGSYKIQRPFVVLNNKAMNESAQDFWNFLLSAEGQALVVKEGYVSDIENPVAFKTNGASATIDVGGSSSVENLMRKLVEEYKKIGGGVNVNIHIPGSGAGIRGAGDGTFAIGTSSREITADEAASLEIANFAFEGVAVIVNSANPITGISIDELKEIYLKDLTRWDEVTR